MKNYPEAILKYVCIRALGTDAFAYILTDEAGKIIEWGGEFEGIAPDLLCTDVFISDIFDFMIGLLPLKGNAHVIKNLNIQMSKRIDVHIFKQKDGYGLIFLDVTGRNDTQISLQQFANTEEVENIKGLSNAISGKDESVCVEEDSQSIKIVKIPATVLSIDIKHTSAQIISLSETKIQERVLPFLKILTKEISENNGYIKTLFGDLLVAVFGIYSRRRNTSSEALFAVQKILEAFSLEYQKQNPTELSIPIRMGMASGSIFIGYSILMGKRIFHCHGDCIQLSKKLMHYALYGHVLIDKETFSVAGNHRELFIPVSIKEDLKSSLYDVYKWEYK
ncbi:MAG: hypothetical protein SWO11_20810 [Thermodesulfobacteriota bacterium]|nr:hypothetical protein [Thermodesulfobacteriota bacterium]